MTTGLLDPTFANAKAGPSSISPSYANRDSLNGDPRRPAFTYGSKAIVDESWTQVDAFANDEDDDVGSDYESEQEVRTTVLCIMGRASDDVRTSTSE